jgi:signal transduction histidine kinase
MQMASSNINLKMLLEKSLKVVESGARKRGIQLKMGIDGISTSIKADERKLKQIIFNLLSNAVKFTPDGGEVCLSAQMLSGCVIRPGRRWKDPQSLRIVEEPVAKNPGTGSQMIKCVQISVSDTGMGINPEDQSRIFDRFEQIQGSINGSRQGAGLGLTLTKTLVEMHGGKIWVDSQGQGKGSRFSFVIPV